MSDESYRVIGVHPISGEEEVTADYIGEGVGRVSSLREAIAAAILSGAEVSRFVIIDQDNQIRDAKMEDLQ